jgi:hypothetical protein
MISIASLPRCLSGIVLGLSVVCALQAGAKAQPSLADAIKAGTPLIDLRLRYENVDQENRPRNATATTLRARIGYQTGQFYGFSALAEFDFLQHLGPEHFFNSFEGGSPALYPTIADPDMVALNRLRLSYGVRLTETANNAPDLRFNLGRQRIIFSDQRFVGNVGWRQHEQTFDGISLVNTPLPATTLTYAYITRVNRVFGPEAPNGTFDSHSHLINAVYGGLMPHLRLEGYTYLLDLRQSPTLSTASYGLRTDGAIELGSSGLSANYIAAFAHQNDYAKNPLSISLNYYLGEAGLGFRGATASIGYEALEGNGTIGFSTPLATLHIFQGWADVFLTTPTDGIEDFHVKAGYGFPLAPLFSRVTATVVYHDFSAEQGDADFGSEWDAQLEATINPNWMLGVKYAAYQGAGPYPDKAIGWLYIGYRY